MVHELTVERLARTARDAVGDGDLGTAGGKGNAEPGGHERSDIPAVRRVADEDDVRILARDRGLDRLPVAVARIGGECLAVDVDDLGCAPGRQLFGEAVDAVSEEEGRYRRAVGARVRGADELEGDVLERRAVVLCQYQYFDRHDAYRTPVFSRMRLMSSAAISSGLPVRISAPLPFGGDSKPTVSSLRRGTSHRRCIEPEIREVQLGDRLLFCGHDPLEAGIARRVDSRLHRDHRGERQVDDLELVVLELSLHPKRARIRHLEAHRGARIRDVEKARDEPPDLGVVVVVGLEAAQDEGERLVLDRLVDHAGQGERVAPGERVVLDMDGPVGTRREARTQRRCRPGGPHGECDDLLDLAGVLERQRLFQRIAVVVIDGER